MFWEANMLYFLWPINQEPGLCQHSVPIQSFQNRQTLEQFFEPLYTNITLTKRLWLVKQVLEFVYGLLKLGQISIAAAGEGKISKGVLKRGVWQSSDLGLPGHPLPNWREGLQHLFVGWVQSWCCTFNLQADGLVKCGLPLGSAYRQTTAAPLFSFWPYTSTQNCQHARTTTSLCIGRSFEQRGRNVCL